MTVSPPPSPFFYASVSSCTFYSSWRNRTSEFFPYPFCFLLLFYFMSPRLLSIVGELIPLSTGSPFLRNMLSFLMRSDIEIVTHFPVHLNNRDSFFSLPRLNSSFSSRRRKTSAKSCWNCERTYAPFLGQPSTLSLTPHDPPLRNL